jgi:hypothetical protein
MIEVTHHAGLSQRLPDCFESYLMELAQRMTGKLESCESTKCARPIARGLQPR